MKAEEQTRWKKNIKQWGHEVGFVAMGFTTADPIEGLDSELQVRMEQGLATPFEGKEIKRRIDPKEDWPSCLTVVALAYPFPFSSPPQKGEGLFARSAVGEDYHYVVFRRIQQLVDIMKSKGWAGSPRFQVDTGPLVERAFAVRGGMGWIGRNQQLIIPGYGSFVSLALLLLDQTIEPDRTVPSQCGDCQKCAQSCPAQIIGKVPFASNRCVSYLTQSKDVLTHEEQRGLGLRVFGCDSCQEACPHNQRWMREEQAHSSQASDLPHRGGDLMEILKLTNDEFKKRYKGTAAGWRGKGVLQRNAFLALRSGHDARYEGWLAEHNRDDLMLPIIVPYHAGKNLN